jgi:Rad9.
MIITYFSFYSLVLCFFQANYSSSGRNEIVLTARTLSNALKNFHTHQAEITLAVDSRKTIINNFDDKTLGK